MRRTEHPVHWKRGGGAGLLPEIKQPGREGYHLPVTSAEFKNEYSYDTTLHVCPYGVYRGKVFIVCMQKVHSRVDSTLLRKWEVQG